MNFKCKEFSAGNMSDLGKAVELFIAALPGITKIQYLNINFNQNTGQYDALLSYIQ